MILTLLFALMCVACVYAAVRTPQWFWTVTVGSAILLERCGLALHQGPSVKLGPLTTRVTDPAILAVLVGSIYHAHRDNQDEHGFQFLTRSPVGGITLCIFLFMAIKLLFSILFRSEDILASRIVSHTAGGIVAAVGDLRETLVPFLPLIYVYAARKSRDLQLLGWPIIVLVGILLANAAVGVVINGISGEPQGPTVVLSAVLSGSAAASPDPEQRFIASEDAINLTIFGILLFFLPVQGISRSWLSAIGVVALVVATIANHRSQWLGLICGLAVFLLMVVLAPPIVRNPKPLRIGIVVALLTVAVLVPAGMYATENRSGTLLPEFLVKRLYAFTDPSRDPDADFREKVWRSQIDQVGGDWPWGLPFGARTETLLKGRWFSVPAHSAYVSIYVSGGAILCALTILFWCRVAQIALLRVLRHRLNERIWPALLALTTIASSLAYGTAYFFPLLGPALAVILTLDDSPDPISVNPPCYRTFKGPDVYLGHLEKA
jgi:hypothetical protein